MKNILKFEVRKLFRMKILYICLGILIGLALLNVLTMYLMYKISTEEIFGEAFIEFASTTAVTILKSELSQQSGTILIALFVTLYVCDDNMNNTLKNIYGRGYGRDGVYFGKLIIALCVALSYAVIDMLFSFVFGCIFFKVGTADATIVGTIVVQLLAALAYASLFFFLTTVIKKTGGAVVCNVLITMFFAMVLTLVDLIIDSESFKIADYWIDGIIAKVAGDVVEAKTYIISTVMTLVYSAAFIVGGMFVNRKREV